MLMFEEILKENWFKIKAFFWYQTIFICYCLSLKEGYILLFIQKLQQSYVKYFNLKYGFLGTIW